MQIHSIPQNSKEKSVCFSSYRLQQFPPNTNFDEVKLTQRNAIADLTQNGYATFLSGMAEGFDMMAIEEVVRLKTESANIRFIACMPCRNFKEFDSNDEEILSQANEIIAVSDKQAQRHITEETVLW